MPQLFSHRMNVIARLSIFGSVLMPVGIIVLLMFLVRSPYLTEAGVIREQPVPFSHRHHVDDVGLDCRYCHTSVEDSSFAGIPSTEICLQCHSQLWRDSPMLAPVRESARQEQPLRWTRVHNLQDFAYFDHSIHIHKGIGCTSCHGDVGDMPLMWREETLLMEWCLDCHRNPAEHVRPRSEVFSTDWHPDTLDETEASVLIDQYHIHSKTDCSICHR